MKLKQIFTWLIKASVAIIISLSLMCGFSLLYDNTPTHFDNTSNATDYKYQPNKFYSKATEGIAWGFTNNDGFNNELDIGQKDIDILLMGSSQEEAYNVKTSQNTASQLNRLFGGKLYTYSIAQSSSTLPYLVRNLDSAINVYKPKKYVLFEVQSIIIKPDAAIKAVNNNLERLTSASGISAELQKVPYFRVLYHQLSDYKLLNAKTDKVSDNQSDSITDEYAESLDLLMKKIEDTCKKHSVEPIIYFHPHLSLNNDKTVTLLDISTPLNEVIDYRNLYKSECEKHGITFVDMSEAFIRSYNENKTLPHGFCNTKIGIGHLNADGHRIIAENLKIIIEEKAVAK